MALQKFPRVYNITDFGITANVTCQAYAWNKVGSVTVPAQQQVTFGNGSSAPTDTRGVLYIKIDNTSDVELTGKWRLALANANETNIVVVSEIRTENASAGSTYSTEISYRLGEFGARAKEDSKLILYFYPDGASAVTIDYDGTDTKFIVPVTVYQ